MSENKDFETAVLDCFEMLGKRIEILHKMLLLLISSDERVFTDHYRRVIMDKAAKLVDDYEQM